MSKIKIKIIILGHLPHSIDFKKISKWRSELFEVVRQIATYSITDNSDGYGWEFSDSSIEAQLPKRQEEDILLAVTNVPLQDNYFARRSTDNRVCLTYNSMTEILLYHNIPLENLVLRVLYSVAFVYRRYGDRLPLITEHTNFTHDETRGCIFDMNGIKTDLIYSLDKPRLCHSCVETLASNRMHRIERSLIDKVQQELQKIKKGLYYQISDFIKRKPVLAIVISSILAVILGIIGSLIASAIWQSWTSTGHNMVLPKAGFT